MEGISCRWGKKIKSLALPPLLQQILEVHSKLLTVNGLVRDTIHVAISIDLEMEAVPLGICVEVHQAISVSPAGVQQWRGVGKGKGGLQAPEQDVPQAAVVTIL